MVVSVDMKKIILKIISICFIVCNFSIICLSQSNQKTEKPYKIFNDEAKALNTLSEDINSLCKEFINSHNDYYENCAEIQDVSFDCSNFLDEISAILFVSEFVTEEENKIIVKGF